MQIQVNTGNGIENKESLERWADAEMRQLLARFSADVTRVEIHLSHESRAGGGGDERCAMEARLAGHPPLAVSHHGGSLDEAFRGAADKLRRALDSTLGRLSGHRDRGSIRRDGDIASE
jgi:ribosome-associated translation inhibitor RaiA